MNSLAARVEEYYEVLGADPRPGVGLEELAEFEQAQGLILPRARGYGTWSRGELLDLTELVYQVAPHDPWTFGVIALTWFATAAPAAWIPARRVSLVDPAVVLRAQ
jgi:ABC-type lipoprotein release transport system permease subunit